MALSYIALGANVAGHHASPRAALDAALRTIDRPGVRVAARSQIYASVAWPDPRDPEFANAAAAVETALSPEALLMLLQAVETEFGRVRREANAPRPLDLDIIDYDGRISGPGDVPVLPHPRLADRAFVLLPLAQIAPGWRHPATGAAIDDLIAQLSNPASAWPIAS